jgi:signal transduction histidine kinase
MAGVRAVVMDLNSLQGRPLTEAIADLCATITGPRIRFAVDGEPYDLPDSTSTVLLRIAQGALANVAEHAQARSASVTLSYLPDQVTLDIIDDGIGFNPAHMKPRVGRGAGLEAIHRRVELAGGHATIESSPSAGTVVAVAVPTRVEMAR